MDKQSISNRVYVQLHHKVTKNTFFLYREDSFFFPACSEKESKGVIEYIRNVLQSKEAYVTIQRVEDNNRLHKGFLPVSDFIKVKMYTSNGKGVVTITEWNSAEECFSDCKQHVTMKDFIIDLQNEIELQESWND